MSDAVKTKPAENRKREVISTTVLERRRLSPSFARLTLGGGDLERFEYQGFDQWFRMFFPTDAQAQLPLPDSPDPGWYTRYREVPEEQRPWMRYVSVRDFRSGGIDGPEMDVDVVVHGEPGTTGAGPLSTWAQTAGRGDPLALLDQGVVFQAEKAVTDVLLVGDEAAVPAIAGILGSLPGDVRGQAIIEVPDPLDVQLISGPIGVGVRWLTRAGVSEVPGELALTAVREHLERAGRSDATRSAAPHETGTSNAYAFGAGESRMVAALRQVMLQDFAWPKEQLTTVGYWHHAGR